MTRTSARWFGSIEGDGGTVTRPQKLSTTTDERYPEMKVTVHGAMCVASGNCGFVAPAVFRNREENGEFVELLDKNPAETEWAAVREAEYLCPSGTIQIEHQPIPPKK